jgi:hypothetical protein
LYAVKQADEFVTLGLSRDDGTRALVLLRQAGVRLDEATRLADSGQVQTAADLLQQYVGTLERAAASLSRAPSVDAKLSTDYQALLQQQLSQLESLARDAPAPLRPTIQQAQLAATQELGGSQAAGQPAPPPTPSAPAVSPAVSPSPAASPATGAPARAPASPSPLSSPVGQPSPTEP